MALRQIRTYGDPVLEKKSKDVKEMTPRIRELIDDMLETMYDQEGVGLAAPQVGVLRRLLVIDVTGMEDEETGEAPEDAKEQSAAAEAGEEHGAGEDAGKKDGGRKSKRHRKKRADGAGQEPPEPDNVRPDGTVVPPWEGPLVMINPVMLETWGEQKGQEGCLSVPGKAGDVTRPSYVRAKALDVDMNEFEVEATGLLARAICHEMDHLDGIVYVTRVEGDLYDVQSEEEEA